MIIPIEWLKQYIKTDKSPKEIAEEFTLLGLLLDKPIKGEGENSVLDLEHRMDRSDWLAVIGCARDLAAFEGKNLTYPEIDENTYPQAQNPVEIKISDKGFVNRFYTRVIKNVKVAPSPDWLKNRLESYGLPTINNIVDITNYVMVELGQPMHAHDIDKMEKLEIEFRKAHTGETIETLLGEKLTLNEDICITANNSKPTGVAGIVGGKMVAIDETTKNIVLDSGNYNQTMVRKTSRKLKIYNETVLRTDKFLHPYLAELAVKRATYLFKQICGAEIEIYENDDYYPTPPKDLQMTLRTSRIKKISGLDIDMPQIERILTSLEYKILNTTSDKIEVLVPPFRTDVEVEDDLVADILRINSYAKIPALPIQSNPPSEITPEIYKFEEKLRNIVVALGGHEHITDPLVRGDNTNVQQIILENSISADKDALRTTVYQTLKEVVPNYKKHRISEVIIFEIGKLYQKSQEQYLETRVLEVIYENLDLSLPEKNQKIKNILASVTRDLGINNYQLVKKGEVAEILVKDLKVGELSLTSVTLFTEPLLTVSAETNKRATTTLPNVSNMDLTIELTSDKLSEGFGKTLDKIKSNPHVVRAEVISQFMTANGKKITVNIDFTGITSELLSRELLI